MNTINVVVKANKPVEYYSLVEVKQKIDAIADAISGEAVIKIEDMDAEDTDVLINHSIIYAWPISPQHLSITLLTPTDTTKTYTYTCIVKADVESIGGVDTAFNLNIISQDDLPIVITPESAIVSAAINKISISYVNSKYYVTISNFK